MKNTLLLLFLMVLFPFLGISQEVLSLEKAVSTALLKNHNVVAVKLSNEIAANNATIGNAGLLPQIGVKSGVNGGVSNSTTEFAGNIPALKVNGAVQVSSNASLYANYTLFEGFKAKNTYQKLKESVDLTTVQTQIAIENTLMLVINAYFQAANFQQQEAVSIEALSISQQRYTRIKAKVEFGSANTLALLNAKVDLNTDSVNLINAILGKEMALNNLSYLLGNDKSTFTKVDTAVAFALPIVLDELIVKAKKNNTALLAATHTLSLSEKELKIIQSAQYPVIKLNSSYGYSQNSNSGSFVAKSQSVGLSGGIALSYNLFNGSQAKRNAQNAIISIESNTEKRIDAESFLAKEVENVFKKYTTQLQIVAIEKNNLKTAVLNFEYSEAAFNLGQINTTEFRTAQINLIRSKLKIATAQYDAKLSEMDLLRLAGMLINN